MKKINTRTTKKSSALASPTRPLSSVDSPTQPISASTVASPTRPLSASAVASPARTISSVASPTQPLSASLTRRAKQAPITQSKPGSSRIQAVNTDIKTEPGSIQAPKFNVLDGQKRMATSVILSDRSYSGKNLIADIATSEVEDKILAEIEEKLSLPVPTKTVKTPEKRLNQAETKLVEKKDGNMMKCWFCDRECK